jgi:hypothetical protein
MTSVTLRPDVVTNHREAGTHIDDKSVLREHWSDSFKGKHYSMLVILPFPYVVTPSGNDTYNLSLSSRVLNIWKDLLSIL